MDDEARRVVEELGRVQAGVLSRRQLYAADVSRADVRAQVQARRWRRVGSQSVALHTGPLGRTARHRAAVFEAGPRAYLDGVSSLVENGVEHLEADVVRVSVPRGVRRRRGRGIDVRQTRRFDPADLAPGSGVPRSRVEVAAVRAALWARSDRQAVLLLTMPVQQRLTTAERVGAALLAVRRDRRRALLHRTVLDLAGGVGSPGELDVLRGCRQRGLPRPTTQAVRETPGGRCYLDLRWDRWALVVEVDGLQHEWVQSLVGDALRHNSIALAGDTVLRIPVLGLRVAPEAFFAQIEAALTSAGWSRGDRAA